MTGWLALFALALQLAVSFAHVHGEDFAGLLVSSAPQAAPADTPGGHPDPDHLTCGICATVHLAGTLALPTAPAALILPVSTTAPGTIAAPITRAVTLASAFHARAPPQA